MGWLNGFGCDYTRFYKKVILGVHVYRSEFGFIETSFGMGGT